MQYCVSGRPFLIVSNAHQIPQVEGLSGLITYNAFTYTKGLREEITFTITMALCCLSAVDENLVVHKRQTDFRAPNLS